MCRFTIIHCKMNNNLKQNILVIFQMFFIRIPFYKLLIEFILYLYVVCGRIACIRNMFLLATNATIKMETFIQLNSFVNECLSEWFIFTHSDKYLNYSRHNIYFGRNVRLHLIPVKYSFYNGDKTEIPLFN